VLIPRKAYGLAESCGGFAKENAQMDMTEIHDYARRLVGAHGTKAESEAALKAAECEKQGDTDQAAAWRRIQAAIKEMRGPHAS
jgi:hypothetical protein